MRSRSILSHGIIAGLVGAASVALWFLVLDAVRRQILFTPAALGSALFLGASGTDEVEITFGIVALYTVAHVAAFIALGLLVAALIHAAESEPPLLLGAVLLFVTLEAAMIGLIAIAAAWLLDELAWWSIGIANIIAALAMGAYLWRAHPKMRRDFGDQELEEPRDVGRV